MQVDIINKGIQIEEKLFGECFENIRTNRGNEKLFRKRQKKKNPLKKK